MNGYFDFLRHYAVTNVLQSIQQEEGVSAGYTLFYLGNNIGVVH